MYTSYFNEALYTSLKKYNCYNLPINKFILKKIKFLANFKLFATPIFNNINVNSSY